MYRVEVKNCNSILNGNIKIEEGKLNIKYGINGTGKTTIAKAIEVAKDSEKLQELKSYFAENPASVTMKPGVRI
jgi:Fe-S cluster assembly ATPase SufC